MELTDVAAAIVDLRTGSLAHAPDRVRQARLLDIVEALANAVAPPQETAPTAPAEGVEGESSTTADDGEGGTDVGAGEDSSQD